MKSRTEYLSFNLPTKMGFLSITHQVEEAVRKSGVMEGMVPLKRQIMGREVVGAMTKGKLDFGPWEQIFYGEFDGNRSKKVLVKIIGE